MRSRGLVYLLCGVLGCADEVASDVELEEHCEQSGPVRLLELASDELVYMVQPFDDDRLRVSIGTQESRTRTVLVPRCGGQEQPVAPNLQWVFVVGDTLLGCDQDYNLVAPVEVGDTDPTVLAGRGCAYRPTPHGLVAIDAAPGDEVGRLVLVQAVDEGDVIVETLLDDLLLELEESYFPGGTDTHAYGRTSDFSAWEIDLASGTRTRLVEGALDFDVSPRHVLYRPIDDIDDGKSMLVLRDRATGVERTVLDAAAESLSIDVTEDVISHGRPNPAHTRWFWTDDLSEIVPPDGMKIVRLLADQRFFLTASGPSGDSLFAIWRRHESPDAVWSCRDCVVDVDEKLGGLVIQHGTSSRYALSFVDEATGVPQPLAGSVTDSYQILGDRRVLTVLDHVEPGPFFLHDYRDGSARAIAERADPQSIFLTRFFAGDDDRDVLWVDVPLDEPAALYHARLAAVD